MPKYENLIEMVTEYRHGLAMRTHRVPIYE